VYEVVKIIVNKFEIWILYQKGIDFHMKNIELDGKKICLQLWVMIFYLIESVHFDFYSYSIGHVWSRKV
jgi:hypothetical protein